ncbi:GIY-YIG nuclease family protein [Burkholderia seminalis]|uniref:GIY-YIG nuclease family protein n=2 Tax=Burkholderia cepacia complex TaxID=87882 RepID=A0A8A8CZT5_9BURK|nr:GIY-YIG nuclease family protein [Burkholderia seminalis]QTO17957.1 GIY-YIG nuclease family protein [Burkholderia seminalis]
MSWFLYLIECADDSVYTGITTDVAARFDEHASGKGARYTRSRKPRAVLASFPLPDRSSASRAEYWVKRLTPVQKRELAAGLRTLESVLPVVATLDESADAAGSPVRTRGRKQAKAENADNLADTAAAQPAAAENVKAGKVGKPAKAATRKPAVTKAKKAAPEAKRAQADGATAVKNTASRGMSVKKTKPPASASSKPKAPAAVGQPAANTRKNAASEPARRRPSAATTIEAAPPRATRAKTAPAAAPSARRKPARPKQNRAAS